ncbi:hypothetical protein EXIGLDRAFT_840896 [Exidia glandulosa HHB12029]|uniref:Uncharacterized protein n=1 Tax=Exidia glandulosa HHB12029 TaxID=1314781 RepID=A0A165E7X1_EXIGL|nr:hypothetical protein EXIGLDRAFT_840896 [Exidia glandulosa HHB12029]
MRLPFILQSRRGGSYQTNKRAEGVHVRVRDVAANGYDSDVGGKKSTTVTVSGEQDGGGVFESGAGQDQQVEIVSSRCISTNSSIHEVYFLLGDEDSVADVAERVKASCSAIVSPAVVLNYNYTSGSDIEISSESWGVVEWYRGSTFALALEGYNSTDTLINISPTLDSPFFTCLNTTISTNLPLLPLSNPIILKSHSGWHPNPHSSKGGEIIVICFLSILFGPFALMLLAIVLLGTVTVVCCCLEMCCTCCGLVSWSESDVTASVETPKPKPKPLVTTPPKRTSAMEHDPEKGGYNLKDSSYAGNSLRFPPDAVIAHTRSVQDWDTFRLLTGSHYHYDDSIMARAYHTSQISRSSNVNNDNIQTMPPKRLTLSEAKSVLVTRTSTTATESEGDKNPFADSDSADSVADSINEAPPRLSED